MADEVELKLALDPGLMARLRRHPTIRGLATAPTSAQALTTIYFDSAGRDLARCGISLRVRRSDGRWIQTIKGPDRGNGAVLTRTEVEVPVPRPEIDLGAFEPAALAEALDGNAVPDELEEVVRVAVRRTLLPVRLIDTRLELCFDRGEIIAGVRQAPLSELEIELVEGSPARVLELALMLADIVPYRLEFRSKLARGLDLAAGRETAAPARAARVALDPALRPDQAFARIVRGCLEQLRANVPAVLTSGEPEGVHQARVAVRRLRALIGVFRHAMRAEAYGELRSELKWLQAALGPARDWDVFLAERVRPVAAAFPDEGGIALLETAAREHRGGAYEAARAALAEMRVIRLQLRAALIVETGAWLDPAMAAEFATPGALERFAEAALDRAERRVRRAAADAGHGDPAALHRLRIQAKKLRYAGEFFESLYGQKASRRFLKRVSRLQDTLGLVNDAAVAERLMRELTPARAEDAVPLATAIGILRGWEAAEAKAGRERFAKLWKAYRKTDRFWSA